MNRPLEEAERRAESHRTAFALAIEELDRRRKLAVDIPYQLRTHASSFVLVAGVVWVGVTAWVLIGRVRQNQRRHRRPRVLAKALVRAYEHPERIATRARDLPVFGRIARKVVVTLVGTLATELARRTARVLLERSRVLERPQAVAQLGAGSPAR